MNRLLIFVCTLFAMHVFAQENNENFTWDLENEKAHNANRNNPDTWDSKLLELDKQVPPGVIKPLSYGAFPVPKYDLIPNNFKGVASGGEWSGISVGDKKIVYLNMQYATDGEQHESNTFFTILVVTDSIAKDGYSHANVLVHSRNHPHYSGEGYVATKNQQIDFVAFQTANKNGYAMVNMRLFDLRIGRIILIAPQKDGSLRSLQLDAEMMPSEEMDSYVKEVLQKNKKVVDLIAHPNTI